MIYRKLSGAKYTPIENEVLQCDKLSYKARGILSALLSRPVDWKVTISQLAKSSPKEGVDAVRTGLTELEAEGYAKLVNVRMEDGTFKGMQWFVSDDKAWIATLSDEVLMKETTKGHLEMVTDTGIDRHGDNPTSVKSKTTKERDIQSNESKSHSPNSVESTPEVDERLLTDHYKLMVEVFDWLHDCMLLKGKNKTKHEKGTEAYKLHRDEVILGRGKNKGWWDTVDKLLRIDLKDEENPFAMLSNAMKWMMYTSDDTDQHGNPINGCFWIEQAGWCSMGTLRKPSRNKEMTQFNQIHAAFERWNKKRKRS